MLKEYFKIIRKALSGSREKGTTYYESHHIIPKCFNKKSKLVLLTPEEHYECHKLLAEIFKNHPVYGQKMLWSFHRLAYDKKRKLSAEEYGEARRMLMPLWKRPKSEKFKRTQSDRMKGSNNPNFKGKYNFGRIFLQETRKKIGNKTRLRLLNKVGESAQASKGIVVCENIYTGEKIEAGSALQLSYILKISPATLSNRLNKNPNKEIKGWKVYYKNQF